MDIFYDPDLWDLSFEDFSKAYEEAIKDFGELGPPKGHPHTILSGYIGERKTCLRICALCGWWLAEDRAMLPAIRWQVWMVTLTSFCVLHDFSVESLDVPIQEVRRHLLRQYETRKSIHPRVFELTVTSVFRDHGYDAVATAYTRDGGVDVILETSTGQRTGIQVKRQRDSVKIEQVRAFLGALILGGFTSGIFLSSSAFSKGARQAAVQSRERSVPVELIDADRFFDMLQVAQLRNPVGVEECGISRSKPLKFRLQNFYHLNAL